MLRGPCAPCMKLALALAALLAAAALLPAPAEAADPLDAWDGCVQYAYVADYHWYYVCVNPRDASCPVYFKERHGMTWTRQCAVETSSDLLPKCIPFANDLEYQYDLCVEPRDLQCPVYVHRHNGGYGTKHCVP